MSFVNLTGRKISFTIVYCGPDGAGRRTTVERLRSLLPENQTGLLSRYPTVDGPGVSVFEYQTIEPGVMRGFTTTFTVSSLPNEPRYDATRRFLLRAADGIVFVGDSQWVHMLDNEQAMGQLRSALQSASRSLETIPLVLQLNKRDLPEVAPKEYMDYLLNRGQSRAAVVETVALDGNGVLEAFDCLREQLACEIGLCETAQTDPGTAV